MFNVKCLILVVGTFFMGGQDAAPSQCNPAHPLAQTSDGKYHAVSSSPTAAPCPKQSHQAAHQQPHVHAVPSRTKTWRRPLMANIMRSQAVQQQLRVQGGLKQPISSQHTHAVPSRTKNWRRPLMVRQPYSVAVRAPRRSGFLFFPEVSVPYKGNRRGRKDY